MGQKKLKVIDLTEEKKKSTVKPSSEKEVVEKEVKKSKTTSKSSTGKTKKTLKKEKKIARKQKIHSKRYQKFLKKIDQNKLYSLTEAVKILINSPKTKIDETIELHLITLKEKLTGSLNLPHGTGKTRKIVIVDDNVLEQIERGKIDFDILIATPKMMSKIAKVARILGPKGLMPSPKNGTITDNPEEAKKKFEGGGVQYKTEVKAPLIHLVLGKFSFGEKKILENLEAAIKTIGASNIKKAVLTSTHSPGIKLSIQ